mmetsp:Transcript_33360/g.48354  ORF Transcript_33360/g.48354 Transcript_33360/m.48354 type:complete len:453 (+) Transcript_33360:78-1436(+)
MICIIIILTFLYLFGVLILINSETLEVPQLPNDIYYDYGGNDQNYHFQMLNDLPRNKAYHKALKKYVNKDTKVLDIGAGTMLLSMMASRLGAKQVIAIEKNEKMCKIGRNILIANNFTKNEIILICDLSTNVVLGSYGFISPANLLVSETLDSWVIEEGLSTSIADAKNRNLITADAIIIPNRAILYAQMVESKFSLPNPAIIEGFNLETLRRFRPMDNSMVIDARSAVSRILSKPAIAFEFDFQNDVSISTLEDYSVIDFTVSKTGNFHAVIFWFDVFLTEDSSIKLTNSPRSNSHWGQMLHFMNHDLNVDVGDSFTLKAFHTDEKFFFSDTHWDSRLVRVQSACNHSVGIYSSPSTTSHTDNGTIQNEDLEYLQELFENAGYLSEVVFSAYVGDTLYFMNQETQHLMEQTFIVGQDLHNLQDVSLCIPHGKTTLAEPVCQDLDVDNLTVF